MRTQEEIVTALSDIYSLAAQLQYAKSIRDSDRFTMEDRVAVFEAYIGALLREQGYPAVKAWLYDLMDWDNLSVKEFLVDEITIKKKTSF